MVGFVRVVLLLTVGIPVFAAQLVAYALPRVEVTPFVLLRRAAQVSEQEQHRDEVIAKATPRTVLVLVPQALDGERYAAPVAPEGASARALDFVKHHHRQGV